MYKRVDINDVICEQLSTWCILETVDIENKNIYMEIGHIGDGCISVYRYNKSRISVDICTDSIEAYQKYVSLRPVRVCVVYNDDAREVGVLHDLEMMSKRILERYASTRYARFIDETLDISEKQICVPEIGFRFEIVSPPIPFGAPVPFGTAHGDKYDILSVAAFIEDEDGTIALRPIYRKHVSVGSVWHYDYDKYIANKLKTYDYFNAKEAHYVYVVSHNMLAASSKLRKFGRV